jgi:hypothetical protein
VWGNFFLSFFFYHYVHQIAGDSSLKVHEIILRNAAVYLTRYIDVSPTILFNHLNNIYLHFRLDEELFLCSLIILTRYLKVANYVLKVSRDSELFYLFILCVIISFKALLDIPIDSGAIASSLSLDSSKIYNNELQIMVSLNWTIFFQMDDVMVLDSVFPVEGLMLLSYASQNQLNSEIPSVILAYERKMKIQYSVTKNLNWTQKSPSSINIFSPFFSTSSDEINNSPSQQISNSSPNELSPPSSMFSSFS